MGIEVDTRIVSMLCCLPGLRLRCQPCLLDVFNAYIAMHTCNTYQLLRILIRCLQAITVRPLSAVRSLIRFAEEPQMFAIEYNDGCPIHVSIDSPFF